MPKGDIRYPVNYFHNGVKVAGRSEDKIPKEGTKRRFKGTLYTIKSFFVGRGFVQVELEKED